MRILYGKIISSKYVRSFTNTAIQKNIQKENWDVLSAVSLERNPIITRDLTELEIKLTKLLHQIEYENSHKSNFEIRVENDEKRAEKVKKGDINISEMDGFPQQTGQDFLDSSLEELRSFKLADRYRNNLESNKKSLDRALDRYLLLLVNEKIGQKNLWVLPQGKNQPGETLRQTAERVLLEKCGDNIRTRFMGNAPSGFYKYRYPKSVRNDSVGAKIFFFKAQFISGQVELLNKSCSDYTWATRQELEKLPYEYLKSVNMFLIDEEH